MFFTGLINIEYDFFDKLKISYTVRTKICLYRKLNKYLDYLKIFEDFIEETERKKWDEDKMYLYYDHYYDCPILESPYLKDDYKFHEEEEYIYQYRIDALNSMFSKDEGDMINTSIQLMANEPQWGRLIAASNYKTKYEVVIRSATENKKYYLLSGFLDKIDSQIAYSKIKELSNEAKKPILLNMHNKEIALLLDDDDLESYYWSGKVMRDNSDYEFEKLMKYNPEGVLWYYTHIERKRIMENKEIIFKILSTIIGFNKNKGKTVFEEQDLIISFFTELDRSSFYSEEYATICLQLSKYNYNHRIFDCIKKYYYYHPEKICRIINEKSDEYFDAGEFERYYELPVYAFNNYENIKSFIQFINENVNDDCKPEAHVLIGKLLSRALDEGLTEKNNIIFKIMDNDSNKNIDSGFVWGYDSLNSVRAVEDGSDQKRISDTINNVAEDIDLEFSHSASLLREISKRYLDNSKIDFITSEFGLDVL